MAFVTWSESFEVGIPEMDADHQRIVTLLNQLHDCLVRREDPVEGRRVLGSLIENVTDHFRREIILMRETAPDFADIHADHYVNLIEELKAARDSLEEFHRNTTLDLLVHQISDLFFLTLTRFCSRLKPLNAAAS